MLKMVLSPYRSRESSIFNEIWCADADSRSKNGHMTQYQYLQIQNFIENRLKRGYISTIYCPINAKFGMRKYDHV